MKPELKRPVSEKRHVEDLVEQRILDFAQKRAHEKDREEIPVFLKDSKPYGILHFGDMHLDDDGTDLALVKRDSLLVGETDGLWAATVGDSHNNWAGKKSFLYGQQATSRDDGLRLVKWQFGLVKKKWLYIVGGNHDCWTGGMGDPLRWLADREEAFYQDAEVRISLHSTNDTQCRINCRHDFNGKSIYNPAHGPMKALTWGCRDHIAICGHWHISGYGVLKDPMTKITMHAIQVGSYKTYDRYAREKGFRDQMISPSCLTVIDPRLEDTDPGKVMVFWNPVQGAEYLTQIRKRA